MSKAEDELEKLSAAILAADAGEGEGWADTYAKAPVQHAQMVKNMAKMQRQIMVYFRDLAKQAPSLINWYEYSVALHEQKTSIHAHNVEAYDINVVVNNDKVNEQDQQFIKVVFDTLASTVTAGLQSAAKEYGKPVGLTSTSEIIQELTTQQLANLVGMKIDKTTGHIVPNPNPKYSIDETTRNKINSSIKTSIRLGENHTDAVKRLQDVIADANRADMIANTETVRGYAEGRAEYAKQSGATGKQWFISNAIDICVDNQAEGVIPADQDFISGDPFEPAHPNCQCQTVYYYGDVGFDY